MKHIILVGFKHVGKSSIVRELSAQLSRPLFDLKERIEQKFEHKNGMKHPCEMIVHTHGEECYKDLESSSLSEIMKYETPCILATTSDTLFNKENKEMLGDHVVIHITAPKGIVFERIMVDGGSVFGTEVEDKFTHFKNMWEESEPVYKELAHHSVENSTSIADVVDEIKSRII